jgi:hypothetical protein
VLLQLTIVLVTSLLRCVNSRWDELAAPASMRHSMRSAGPISTGPSPVSRRGASSFGYGSQTMAIGRENIIAAGLGLVRLKLWGALSFLFHGRRALWYSITDRRLSHPEEFRADMAALFELLRNGAIHPIVIGREPLAAAKNVHARIDAGGLGGKIVLLPWLAV